MTEAEPGVALVVKLGLLAACWILRPIGRWLAPLYAGPAGRRALLITCALGGAGFWAAFPVSSKSIVVAICLVVLAPLAASFALVSYVDAMRATRVQRVFVHHPRHDERDSRLPGDGPP